MGLGGGADPSWTAPMIVEGMGARMKLKKIIVMAMAAAAVAVLIKKMGRMM